MMTIIIIAFCHQTNEQKNTHQLTLHFPPSNFFAQSSRGHFASRSQFVPLNLSKSRNNFMINKQKGKTKLILEILQIILISLTNFCSLSNNSSVIIKPDLSPRFMLINSLTSVNLYAVYLTALRQLIETITSSSQT